MLIFGRDPSHELTGQPRGYVPIMTALKQAIERGEVPAKRTPNLFEGRNYSLDAEDKAFVMQADVRHWLESINHNDAFFFLAEPDAWPNKSGTPPKHARDADKPLDARERISLLRIIRALDVMAKLPDRGAAPCIEMQLQQLGFNSPRDSAIRSAIHEARALEPDNKTL